MRASDIGIVSPVDATMVTSGAAARDDRPDQGRRHRRSTPRATTGFYRDDSRSAPYNLMADLVETADARRAGRGRPARRLPAVGRPRRTCPQGQPAKTIAATFSGGHTTNWRSTAAATSTTTATPTRRRSSRPTRCWCCACEVGDAGYTDPAGNPVPETMLEGTGRRCSSTTAGWCAAPGARRTWTRRIELSTKAGDSSSRPGTPGSSWSRSTTGRRHLHEDSEQAGALAGGASTPSRPGSGTP